MTKGLVLHLESEAGVAVRDGVVTRWSDLSGRSNHVFGRGDPALKGSATPSGRAAISLDEKGDKLERVHEKDRLNALPMGNSDRTVLLAARYHNANWWSGFAYGTGERNRAFGLVVDPNDGTLAVQGWGRGNDHQTDAPGIDAGWLLQASVVKDGETWLFRNGSEVLRARHDYNTTPERIVIGEEIAGLGSTAMDVAAVLVYDRALSSSERRSVEAYLTQKYLQSTARNSAPAVKIRSPKHDSRSTVGDTVQLSASAKDPEDGELGAAIEWRSSRDGSLGRGSALATSRLSQGTHTITASVRDSRNASDTAEVEHTVTARNGGSSSPVEEPARQPGGGGGKVIKLFNGRSLDGLYVWSMSEGRNPRKKIFTVKDGMIRVASDERYAALISEREYSNYIMTMEFKWGDATYGHRKGKARDAGIMLHSHGKDGGWKGRLMANLEVQVLEGGMGDLMMLRGDHPMRMSVACSQGKCENRTWYCRGEYRWAPGKARKTFTGSKDYAETVHWSGWDGAFRDVAGFRGRNDLDKRRGEWNRFVIVCDEDRVEVYFNGVKVNEAFNVSPSRGRVQLESEMAEYYVRRWELELLD